MNINEKQTMINATPPPSHAIETDQEEQPTQAALADRANTPAANQPNPAVLATGKDYIDKYSPLWQALANQPE